MTGKALWQNLKKLVLYDQELIRLDQAIIEKKKQIIAHHNQISKLTEQITQLKADLFAAKKDADMLQLQANALRENEDQKRERLENIKDQREYMAVEKELSLLTHKRLTLDDATLKSWHQLEAAQQRYDNAVANYDQNQEDLKQLIAADEQALVEMHEKEELCEQAREAHEQIIPEEWRIRYDRMKDQVPDPIVPMHGSCCSVCFYSALAQDILKLKKQGILPCRNCYRFLYYDEEQETSQTKTN